MVVHPHHPSISDPQPPVSEEKTVPTHPMHRELSLILKEIKVGTSICKNIIYIVKIFCIVGVGDN